MSSKTYLLTVQLPLCSYIGQPSNEQLERDNLKQINKLDALAAELVSAGLSNGAYIPLPHWSQYQYMVTSPRAACEIAEKHRDYIRAIYISKPGGRDFEFDTVRAVPTWLFREVTAEQRKFNIKLDSMIWVLSYLHGKVTEPAHVELFRQVEENVRNTTNIEELDKMERRINHYRKKYGLFG